MWHLNFLSKMNSRSYVFTKNNTSDQTTTCHKSLLLLLIETPPIFFSKWFESRMLKVTSFHHSIILAQTLLATSHYNKQWSSNMGTISSVNQCLFCQVPSSPVIFSSLPSIRIRLLSLEVACTIMSLAIHPQSSSFWCPPILKEFWPKTHHHHLVPISKRPCEK